MVTVRTIYFNTGNSTSALSVYLYFCYDSFSENLLFHSTALIPFYLSLRRIWRCCINLSVQFPWSSSQRTSQLFECVIYCLITSGAVWTVHSMTEHKTTHGRRTWTEKFWSMKGRAANIQSASEYVTFALSSTLSVSKQESLLLIWVCCPLNVGCSWRRIDRKGKYASRPANCSKAPEPNCAFCRHQLMRYMSSVWVYIVIPPLNI